LVKKRCSVEWHALQSSTVAVPPSDLGTRWCFEMPLTWRKHNSQARSPSKTVTGCNAGGFELARFMLG
jgi:hypothetical protein